MDFVMLNTPDEFITYFKDFSEKYPESIPQIKHFFNCMSEGSFQKCSFCGEDTEAMALANIGDEKEFYWLGGPKNQQYLFALCIDCKIEKNLKNNVSTYIKSVVSQMRAKNN